MNTRQRFIKAQENLASFYKENRATLEKYEELQTEVQGLEDILKGDAKNAKEDIEAGDWRFQYVQRFKKWIDYKTALKEVGPENKSLLDSITDFKAEVDMDAFISLCREGALPDKARIKAYQEEEIAPQVRLTKNKE